MADRGEERAQVGDLEIAYEELGDPAGSPMLLVSGLATQMISWEDEFCEILGARGFRLIRFDNRDVGRSSAVDEPYDLDDMASDVAGLLDALGIDTAHIVGRSLGGMIGQMLAAGHPDRVLSLASVMSTTGDKAVGRPDPAVISMLFEPLRTDRSGYVAGYVRLYGAIGSPAYPVGKEALEQMAERAFERGINARGAGRQLMASIQMGDRTERLGVIRAPTVVIHGSDDRLINVSGGVATTAAIPGARWVEIKGMGHDLPRELWPQLVEEIAQNAKRAPETAEAAG